MFFLSLPSESWKYLCGKDKVKLRSQGHGKVKHCVSWCPGTTAHQINDHNFLWFCEESRDFILGPFLIWVRSGRCGCLVTRFCYQLIAKPANKTAAPPWPESYKFWYEINSVQSTEREEKLKINHEKECEKSYINENFNMLFPTHFLRTALLRDRW